MLGQILSYDVQGTLCSLYGTECSQEGSDLNKCELEEIWCHPTFPRFGFRSETE